MARLKDPERVEAVRAWVEASCGAQGVPVKVEDAGALEEAASLLREREDAA
jgi:hypothetical protein